MARVCQDRPVRSKPSDADLELIARLHDERDIEVSHSQLERWRTRGLLPRAQVVRERFGGTRVQPHDGETFEAASCLGVVSRRSRPWQWDAMVLFNEGFDISPKALRETATFLLDVQTRTMRKAWARAEREAPPSNHPDEEAAEIGERAASLLPRTARRLVRDEVAMAHPGATERQIREFADRALTWRMVDLAMPARLNETHRNLARHGVEEPMPVLSDVGVFPLPSERLVVAQTISWAEAELYRQFAFLRLEEDPRLEAQGAFTIMTWIVTAEQSHLESGRQELVELVAERGERAEKETG
jgi:hypothetical protein